MTLQNSRLSSTASTVALCSSANRFTLILSALLMVVSLNGFAATAASDELRFTLPAVRTGSLYVPARIASVTRTEAASMHAGMVHVKTRSTQRPQKNALSFQSVAWTQTLAPLNVRSITPLIRETTEPRLEERAFGLDRIFEVLIDPSLDVFEACRRIAENPDVEYVTPVFVRTTSFTPSDPRFSSQYALARIQAEKAWDINIGTASMVIADVDSGVDFEHEDLAGNLWNNPGETGNDSQGKDKRTNGVDDDKNGYIDDFRGWDFVGNISLNEAATGTYKPDNDPKVRASNIDASRNHGTGTTGCAAAVTNNGKGMASSGFSCKYLPIKCGSDQFGNAVLRGYDGVRYAANLGAKIINCSWGGEGGSPAEQDLINYATAKGSLVIAAAGNDSKNIDSFNQFPANYDNVLVVGATDANDKRAGFSNSGLRVDVWAPGDNVLLTASNNQYVTQSGTSFSCPLVAGVAGLIRSLHPDWTPKMVMHQLRSTCDNVLVTIPSARPQFYGRVNAYKALTENTNLNPGTLPGLEISSVDFGGKTELTSIAPVATRLALRNYLGKASNVVVTLAPQSTGIVFSKTTFSVPTVNAADSVILECTTSPQAPTYFMKNSVDVLVTMTSGTYTNYQKITVPVNIVSSSNYSAYASTPALTYTGAYAKSPVTFWAVGKTAAGKNFVMRGTTIDSTRSDELTCVWGNSSQIANVGTGTGVVLRTSNGGTAWTRVNVSTIVSRVYNINFSDATNGVLIGAPANGAWSAASTSDGGVTWNKSGTLPTPQTGEVSQQNAVAWSGDNVWVGTSKGRVCVSNDKGATWKSYTIASNVVVTQIAFANATFGYALTRATGATSESATVFATVDGGKTWTATGSTFPSNGAHPVYAYAPPNSVQCVLVCSLSEVVMSTDTGRTFTPVLSENGLTAATGFGLTAGTSTVTMYVLGKTIGVLKFPYSGTAGVAELSTDAEVVWDTVNIGSSANKTLGVRNTGSAPLSVTATAIDAGSGSSVGEFTIAGASPVLLPGEFANYIITFSPSVEGTRQATLTITSNGGTKNVILRGVGKLFINSVADDANNVQVRPQPAGAEVTVSSERLSDGTCEVEVVALDGRLVQITRADVRAGSCTVPTGELPSGAYAVRIRQSGNLRLTTFLVRQ